MHNLCNKCTKTGKGTVNLKITFNLLDIVSDFVFLHIYVVIFIYPWPTFAIFCHSPYSSGLWSQSRDWRWTVMHTRFRHVFELRLSAVKPLRCSAGKHITNRSTHIVKNNCIVGSSTRLHRTHNFMYAPQLQRVKYRV